MKPALLIHIALFIVSSTFGQSTFNRKQLQDLDSISLQDIPLFSPGIATAILKDGKVVYEKCAGYASLTDSSLINRKTRFNIASNGKQFTALAILTLIEAKKLSLSDDIRKFLPGLFRTVRSGIPVQSLLNHTSGIRDCYDLLNLQGITWWEKSFSNKDILNLIEKQTDLNFAPGTKFLYSNTNYILLALIIEKVSGKAFVAYTNDMFQKLKMYHTGFVDDYTTIPGNIARAYFNFGTWTTYDWIWNVCGDGNIFTTLEDQIQWERIVQGKAATSLKRKLIQQSQQQFDRGNFKNYGYGVEFGSYKGLDYIFHEGATGAWKATVARFPVQGMTFITLTNSGKAIPAMQNRQMVDVAFGLSSGKAGFLTRPVQVGKYVSETDIVGTYLTESDYAYQFENINRALFLKRIGRSDVELERESDNIFHQKNDSLFKLEFIRDSMGRFQVTAYYINHEPYSLVKQAGGFTDMNFVGLNGTYLNAETGTAINITYKQENSYSIAFGQSGYVANGLMITDGKMLVDSYVLTFDKNSTRIDTIYLNGDRIKAVKFVRQQ